MTKNDGWKAELERFRIAYRIGLAKDIEPMSLRAINELVDLKNRVRRETFEEAIAICDAASDEIGPRVLATRLRDAMNGRLEQIGEGR